MLRERDREQFQEQSDHSLAGDVSEELLCEGAMEGGWRSVLN